MKHLKLTTLILGFLLFGCRQADTKTISVTDDKITTSTHDKEEIQTLIRQVLNWADNKGTIDFLPILENENDTLIREFDLEKHEKNLNLIRKTDFFAKEFIENYNQIILTLNKNLKENKYGEWYNNEMPPFNFYSGVNPWCLCQDIPYSDPDPWKFVEIEIIDLEKGQMTWKWGNSETEVPENWKEFRYRFRVVKENNKWKISYLHGFDLKDNT